MIKSLQRLGQQGENLAIKKLQSDGYKIIGKNFRSRFGEIDIIAIENSTIVFVEVKTRLGNKYGKAKEAINSSKIKKIKLTVDYYLLLHPNYKEYRIDCVTIDINPISYQMTIEVFKNIC